MDVWISETTRYDMIYLVSHDLIKKLPKYAVGDVVRRNNKQLIKCEITSVDQLCDKTYIYTLSDCGSARFSESMLITFDGFRVGDTVWTVKRGKGTIVTGCTSSTKRPHCVNYDDGKYPKCVYPKLSNLFPTERKMLESLPIKVAYAIPFPGVMPDVVAEMLGYKWNPTTAGQATADQMRPKFKEGDAVYSGGTKWIIDDVQQHNGYRIRSTERPHLYVIAYESNLRLWKETKLTHCLQRNSDSWYESDYLKPSDLKYLGSINGHDTFIGTSMGLTLYRGIKGDDIS